MSDDVVLTHDSAVNMFETADGAVTTDADGDTEVSWDKETLVRVDAPADLEGAFNTNTFYKITDATIARPIKQAYVRDGEVTWQKKPADELRKAAWSWDNSPFTLSHPNTGMVKNVDDIHGFWRQTHYDGGEHRLKSTLYIPSNDAEAKEWVEEHSDVSVGFYNRTVDEYDGETGDLTDDNVDTFQVDMYGNHVAGVKRGRCSGGDGCGLVNDVSDITSDFLADQEDLDLSIPETAQNNAQDFLDAVDDGRVPEDCGGPDGLGRDRARMFADGGELSLEIWVTGGTSAVANWHPRHEGNEDYDESEVDTPWEDCGYAMFKAWGGAAAREKAASLKSQYEQTNDASTSVETEKDFTMADTYNEGAMVSWQGGDARGEIIDYKTDGCYSDRIDGDVEVCAGDSVVYLIEEDDGKTVAHKHDSLAVESTDACGCGVTTDAHIEGAYHVDDKAFGIGPDEHNDDSTEHADDAKFPLNSCNDVRDAWNLRGNGDYNIEQSTLEQRIKRAAEAHDCPNEYTPWESEENMDNEFTIEVDVDSNATVDALAEQFDAVAELKAEKEEAEEVLDTRRERIDEAFDTADNFSIELDEDECRCDGVKQIVGDLDEQIKRVEDLEDELSEYRQEDIAERLDTLDDLGADRDEWKETADESDDPLDVLDEEIERREEVADAVSDGSTVKNLDTGSESTSDSESYGTRSFGRGYGA